MKKNDKKTICKYFISGPKMYGWSLHETPMSILSSGRVLWSWNEIRIRSKSSKRNERKDKQGNCRTKPIEQKFIIQTSHQSTSKWPRSRCSKFLDVSFFYRFLSKGMPEPKILFSLHNSRKTQKPKTTEKNKIGRGNLFLLLMQPKPTDFCPVFNYPF